MTIHLPEDLADAVRAEIVNGHFGSEDDLVAAAVRDYLERKHVQSRETGEAEADISAACVKEEVDATELQRRLFEAGVLSEIKPPIADLSAYQGRQAVPIQGEPLSHTVIRERR
jgi:Arc/MetJ-type ribon-helix-helix transcriptional regulator